MRTAAQEAQVAADQLDPLWRQHSQVQSYSVEEEAEEQGEHLVARVTMILHISLLEGQEVLGEQEGQEEQEEELLLCMEVQELQYPIAEQLL